MPYRSRSVLRVMAACCALTLNSTFIWAQSHGSDSETDSQTLIEDWVETLTTSLYADSVPETLQYEVVPLTDVTFVASITNTTKTEDRHGLLRLRWDQQEVVNFNIFLADNQLYVTEVTGYVQEKAPWGAWHLEVEGVPALYARIAPEVGDVIAQE